MNLQILTLNSTSPRIRNMSAAVNLLAKWINEETPLQFWCEQVENLWFGKEIGQCVIKKVSDNQIELHKPNGRVVEFRSPEGFIVEPCLASFIEGAFQVHI